MEKTPVTVPQRTRETSSESVQQLLQKVIAAESLLPDIRLKVFRFCCLFFGAVLCAIACAGAVRALQGGNAANLWLFPLTGAGIFAGFYWRTKRRVSLGGVEVQAFSLAVFLLEVTSLLTNGTLPLYFLFPIICLLYLIQEVGTARLWASALVLLSPLAFVNHPMEVPVLVRALLCALAMAVLMDLMMRNVAQMMATFRHAGITLRDLTGSLMDENARLESAVAAATVASKAKSEFVANMSHEIRTPMNAILGMLALLRKTELSARQADYATKSEGAARSLLGLLNEVLDFSKMESGKMVLDPHPMVVEQLLRDLAVVFSANLGDKPVEVLFDIDPALPPVLVCDAMRMQQVLLNLGSNAIKFTEKGEVVLGIRVVRSLGEAVTLEFSVRDSGIGIAPENQARIFSSFTQAESSTTRRFGGTGLGLVISQRFVAMMGGELELQSVLGQGSRFFYTVTLPVAPNQQALVNRHVHGAWSAGPVRALLVDDNPIAREVLRHVVESLGWEADVADSGAQALQMVGQGLALGRPMYQVILVDWSMPEMDGLQALQAMRELLAQHLLANAGTVQPLFFLVTAHGREKLARRTAVEQALPDGHLVKPVTANMLLEALLEAGHAKESPPAEKGDLHSAQHRLPGMRLLLVDDNLINQQVAQELLEAEGAVVDVAANGQEAVEAVAAAGAAYDVVLMDLQMPVMDGFAATRVIRYEMGLKTLPIVAMTANAMASDRDAALAAGMNDHVGKPFDLTQLVQVLRVQAGRGGALAQAVTEGATLPDSVLQVADRVEVDINAALKRLGGKRDVYHRMLQSFVHDLQSMPAQLRTAEPPDGRRIVHSFKGLTATLGARALSTRAADLEKAMLVDTDGSSAQYQRAVDDLCNAMVQAQAALAVLVDALAQDTGTESSRSDSSGAVNLTAVRGQLQLLVNLLERQDMEALNAMAELQAQWGERGSGESAALEQAMAALDFEAALPLARALEQKFSAV